MASDESEHAQLQTKAEPLFHEIVDGMLEVIPERWASARLTLRKQPGAEKGTESWQHAITSDDRIHGEAAVPSDKLYEATIALVRLFRAYNEDWHAATITIRRMAGAEEHWDYTFSFEYPGIS